MSVIGIEKWHGTVGGYTNHDCRCDDCKRANSENLRRWRAERRRIGTPPDHVHGTDNGYNNYGCRCQPCKDAHAAWARSYEPRRRQQKAAELAPSA